MEAQIHCIERLCCRMYVCMYVRMDVSAYVYIYIYTYRIHIYTSLSLSLSLCYPPTLLPSFPPSLPLLFLSLPPPPSVNSISLRIPRAHIDAKLPELKVCGSLHFQMQVRKLHSSSFLVQGFQIQHSNVQDYSLKPRATSADSILAVVALPSAMPNAGAITLTVQWISRCACKLF